MIALFLPHYRWVAACAELLKDGTMEVDGPFRLADGFLRSQSVPVRCYAVAGGSDAAYSAARLAQRRGAETLIPLSEISMRRPTAEDADLELGSFAPLGDCWDLDGLEPLLRVLPESADTLPRPLAPLMPKKPVCRGEGISVGTLPFPSKNPWLAKALDEQSGIKALDRQMAGYAAAAKEMDHHLRGMVQLREILTRRGPEQLSDQEMDDSFIEFLAALLDQQVISEE